MDIQKICPVYTIDSILNYISIVFVCNCKVSNVVILVCIRSKEQN